MPESLIWITLSEHVSPLCCILTVKSLTQDDAPTTSEWSAIILPIKVRTYIRSVTVYLRIILWKKLIAYCSISGQLGCENNEGFRDEYKYTIGQCIIILYYENDTRQIKH